MAGNESDSDLDFSDRELCVYRYLLKLSAHVYLALYLTSQTSAIACASMTFSQLSVFNRYSYKGKLA